MATANNTTTTNLNDYRSMYQERVVQPAEGGDAYTWARVRGWSGNPEFYRFFPETEGRDGNILSAMFCMQIAIENPVTMETQWLDVNVYDDERTGNNLATQMATHMPPQGGKVGFFHLEGYLKTESFTDKNTGEDRVKTKIIAKQIHCKALKKHNPTPTERNDSTPASVFGAVITEGSEAVLRAAEPSPEPKPEKKAPAENSDNQTPRKGSLADVVAGMEDAPF